MRLTSVTLQGFKSFANRTAIEFSPRVTAIVGPNGSGKSNVLDALKWATGGGRAREFRAEEKTDLIFHGAAGKRSLGFAEVEVVLADGRRTFTIRRDLDRDGTSRLRLNGVGARFVDVDEALAGSGLGTSGVAIIGQGEVSGVLMADPEDLLQYVAEVAGVARLSGRRDATVARLQTARGHLARLEDVLTTLREQVEALRVEAEDASAHQALSREALQLKVTAAHARVEALSAEAAELRAREAASEGALARAHEATDLARSTVARSRSALGEAEARYREATALVEQRRGAANLAAAARDRAVERHQVADVRRRELEEEVGRLELVSAPPPPPGDPAVLAAAVADLGARAVAARDAAAVAERAATELSSELGRARAAAGAAERALSAQQARAASLTDQLETARRDLERVGTGASDDAEPRRLAAVTTEREAGAAEAAAEAVAEAARAALGERHRDHALAAAEAEARSRAAERARAALAARQGYAQGPRHALTSRIPGVVGSVADLVRTPERYAQAIAGALGRRAEYVVVDTAETGERVLEHVRRAGGWVTVLPLDLVRGERPTSWRPASERGLVGQAADLVEVDETYRPMVDSLLGTTVVVERMADATAIARAERRRPRLVTLDGDLVEPGGAMSGGRRTGVGVLGAAKDLEDAEAAAAAALERAEAEGVRLQAAQASATASATAALAARERHREASLAHARLREAAHAHARVHEELAARLARLEAAAAAAGDGGGSSDADIAADVDRTRTALEGADQAWSLADEARRTADALRRDVDAHLARAREALAVDAERRRAYDADRRRFDEAQARLARLREEVGAQRERVARSAQEVRDATVAAEAASAAIPTDLEGVERTYEAARAATATADSRLDALTRRHVDLGREIEEVRVSLARREAALELAREELGALPQGVTRVDLGERAARARLREVEDALSAIGPVNHRAATDHAARRERLENLEVEAVQATLAVTDLEATLERIDRETTARLGAAIERLKVGFRSHVRALFGGDALGEVDAEHDGSRPVGLRIRLQPPGKQTQSLGLLSVGERTMGALAFLFALMADEGVGLPIAVLDEVDAPLDEANIRRFGEFLDALSRRGTQFVLITHQKATFEVADTLWGVTTEGGVSRVFSIRRDERQEALFEAAAAGGATGPA